MRLLQNLLKLTPLHTKALARKSMYKRCNDALSVLVFFQDIVIKVFFSGQNIECSIQVLNRKER